MKRRNIYEKTFVFNIRSMTQNIVHTNINSCFEVTTLLLNFFRQMIWFQLVLENHQNISVNFWLSTCKH